MCGSSKRACVWFSGLCDNMLLCGMFIFGVLSLVGVFVCLSVICYLERSDALCQFAGGRGVLSGCARVVYVRG